MIFLVLVQYGDRILLQAEAVVRMTKCVLEIRVGKFTTHQPQR